MEDLLVITCGKWRFEYKGDWETVVEVVARMERVRQEVTIEKVYSLVENVTSYIEDDIERILRDLGYEF